MVTVSAYQQNTALQKYGLSHVADLSEEFGIAESSLKRCFKSIAGKSIGTFIKVKRIEAANTALQKYGLSHVLTSPIAAYHYCIVYLGFSSH